MKRISASIGAVSRRFSDNIANGATVTQPMASANNTTSSSLSSASLGTTPRDEGISSTCSRSTSNSSTDKTHASSWPSTVNVPRPPPNHNYTLGIDVQTLNFPGSGEFSVWEFGGYEAFHVFFDHMVGNADCLHLLTVCLSASRCPQRFIDIQVDVRQPIEVQYSQVAAKIDPESAGRCFL